MYINCSRIEHKMPLDGNNIELYTRFGRRICSSYSTLLMHNDIEYVEIPISLLDTYMFNDEPIGSDKIILRSKDFKMPYTTMYTREGLHPRFKAWHVYIRVENLYRKY